MLDLATNGGLLGEEPEGEAGGSGGGRLAPLPQRVAAPGDEVAPGLPKPPVEYVEELVERAYVLLSTLDHDVQDLQEDEAKLQLRIEDEQERRRKEASDAKAEVEALAERAFAIAQSKGKVPVLEQGLLHSKVPDDETVDLRALLAELEVELKAAKGITGAIRLGRIGELLQQANLLVRRLRDEAEGLRDRQLEFANQERHAETKEATASFEIGTTILQRDLEILEANVPLASRRWSADGWSSWSPPADEPELLRLGQYHHDELDAEIPLVLAFPFEHAVVLEAMNRRDETIHGVQSLLLRMVAGLPAGAVRFTLVDPKGLGESVAPILPLGEFDAELIDGAVAVTPEQIEDRLVELTHQIERINTLYLGGTFESLAACNREAGEIVEPYRVLVVLDHPAQLSERATQLLSTIAETGSRCGVLTIITKDAQPSYAAARVALPSQAWTVRSGPAGHTIDAPNAGQWVVRLDEPPTAPTEDGPSLAERIVLEAGRRAGEARESALELGKLYDLMNRAAAKLPGGPGLPDTEDDVDPGDPITWWTASAADGLAVPLGRIGATSLASLSFDAKRPSALLTGRAGSGVSSLLHSVLTGLTMLYSPAELELYLIGFRGSRELGVYGDQRLPHARLVAVEADRDYGVAILKELTAELERRLALLRDTVGERAGYEGHRESEPADPLPRVLVVLDQFATLVSPDDRTSQRAASLLDQLARLGPTAGIHLLFVTPADTTPLTAPVMSLVRQRLLLGMEDHHANLLAGDAAPELEPLGRPGDAVLLPNASEPGAAKRFRAVWLDPTEQTISLRDLQRLSQDRQLGEAPQFYDGGAEARLERRDLSHLIGDGSQQGNRRIPRLWLGEPPHLGAPVEVLLRRQEGSNLLVVAEDPEIGQGLLLSSIISSLLVHGDAVGVLTLDFMPPDAGFSEAVHALTAGPWNIQLARRRSLIKVVDIIHRIVQDRLATGETRGKPVLFAINGLGRARDLEVGPVGAAHPDDLHLLGTIETIVSDGPEVGVHTIAWCDTYAALNRRLPKTTVREFALRIAGPLGREDSLAFLDSESATSLEGGEALFADDDIGKLRKLRPYAVPSIDWLEQLADVARQAT